MKKHYGQITRAYGNTALLMAAFIVVCGIISALLLNPYVGIVEAAVGVIAFVIVLILNQKRSARVKGYLELLSKGTGAMSASIMGALPLPAAVVHIDGTVRWCNDKFSALFDTAHIAEARLESLIPDVKWGEILKNGGSYEKQIRIGDRKYTFVANMVKNKTNSSAGEEDKVSVCVYLIDRTNEAAMKIMYDNEKTDIAIINIDNYDDVLQRINDNEQQQILSRIRQCVSEWAAESGALVKATDRDRYYMFFEHRFLSMYISKKFDILNKVREIGDELKLPVSISIGVGMGGSLSDNDGYARSALDMALGRGGDQASIKDDVQFKFFGSKARDYEKSTRVKTRATAVAFKDFINNSDKVIFMGHSGADYDCFGAAVGLQRAVRTLGKKPYIIHDGNSPAISAMYDELKNIEEYRGMFVSPEASLELLTPETLVVVLDTHRTAMLPALRLVQNESKIVLIDHHRRSTDFLSPCSLIYHEPYASSTCEMATELLEYMNLGSSLTTLEAECLYTGILMDTKNFLVKTGVRTFEAASYLRRLGLNTADIKKLFNVSKDDYVRRSDIVRTCEIIAPHIAVARTYENMPNIRVIASQASDEMLNIGDIRASIVVYPLDNAQTGSAVRTRAKTAEMAIIFLYTMIHVLNVKFFCVYFEIIHAKFSGII